MAVLDLYSKRLGRDGPPDTYVYDVLPEKLRVQIIQIWRAVLGVPQRRSGRG